MPLCRADWPASSTRASAPRCLARRGVCERFRQLITAPSRWRRNPHPARRIRYSATVAREQSYRDPSLW